jgi:hypothetical protein
MEKETSISKENLIEKLHYAAKLVKEKYGVSIWFAEIMGRRWSYLAGQKEGEISLLPLERIELNERFGIVSDMWGKIPPDEREKLISSLKDTIKTYGQG